MRVRELTQIGARLLVLGATAWLLVATSAPECSDDSPVVVFQVDGTCGPAGLVVVGNTLDYERRYGSGGLAVGNPAPLGLAPGAEVYPFGAGCPSIVDRDGFRYEGGRARGLDAGGAGDGGVPEGTRCETRKEAGQFTWVCQRTGIEVCRSTLKVVP